jgi:hypothetical protein
VELGGSLKGRFEEVAKRLHIEVDGAMEPLLVLLAGESADEAKAALRIREDAKDVSAALEFLVEAFEEIGGFDVFVMFARLTIKGPGFLDVLLGPRAKLWVFGRPAFDP